MRRSPAIEASFNPDAPRLACVRPAASVHPEPGSNSPLYKIINVLLESWLLNFLKGIWQINTTFLFLSILPVIQRTNLKKSRDFPSRFGLQRYVIFFNPPNLFSRTFAFSFFAPSSENRIKLLFEQLFFSNADAKVGIILESANVLMIFISKNVIFLHLHPDTYL